MVCTTGSWHDLAEGANAGVGYTGEFLRSK
jgi:hypothetical protein